MAKKESQKEECREAAVVPAGNRIITTQSALAEAVRAAIENCFADPYATGPRPRETVVDCIIFGILDRVQTADRSR